MILEVDIIRRSNIIFVIETETDVMNLSFYASYYKNKSILIISYFYTSPIASNIFSYKRLLQNLEIEASRLNHQTVLAKTLFSIMVHPVTSLREV